MIRNREQLELFSARLEQAGTTREGYRDTLEFARLVMSYLFDGREAVAPACLPSLSAADAAVRLGEGFPLMDRFRVVPDVVSAREFLLGLLDLGVKERGLPVEIAAPFHAAVRERPQGADAVLLRWFREGKTPSEGGEHADAETLWRFILHNALRPFHERYALATEGLTIGIDWDRGYCPICGGTPALEAFVGEEGRRELLCHRCSHTWSFSRVRCPFCENSMGGSQRYLVVEEEPFYRIDLCDACKGFIKGVDTRKAGGEDVSLEAEALITPHLDLLAEKEGFVRKSPAFLMI